MNIYIYIYIHIHKYKLQKYDINTFYNILKYLLYFTYVN